MPKTRTVWRKNPPGGRKIVSLPFLFRKEKTFRTRLFRFFEFIENAQNPRRLSKSGKKTRFHENEKKHCLEKKSSEGVGRLFLCLFVVAFCLPKRTCFSKSGENTRFHENEKNNCWENKSSEGVGRLFLCLFFAILVSANQHLLEIMGKINISQK